MPGVQYPPQYKMENGKIEACGKPLAIKFQACDRCDSKKHNKLFVNVNGGKNGTNLTNVSIIQQPLQLWLPFFALKLI